MITSRLPLLACWLLGVLLSTGTFAADSDRRYAPWPGDTGTAGEFVESLRALIERAERDRAASPDFLQDLRDLAARHESAPSAAALSDAFEDGDFARNPAWTVQRGSFFIERGYGLRSIVPLAAAAGRGTTTTRREEKREATQQIFGAILNQVIEQKLGTVSGEDEPAPTDAAIFTRVRAGNAFALDMDFWIGAKAGRLEVEVFQGEQPGVGYRVMMAPADRPALAVVRVGASGEAVIDTAIRQLRVEPGRVHRLRWTRGGQGEMTVSIDGEQMVRASDRAFRDAWDGVAVRNGGGDFTIRRIVLNARP
ncbi:MAG: hypothetical protein WD270_14080 [Acetobacterales bacterium]